MQFVLHICFCIAGELRHNPRLRDHHQYRANMMNISTRSRPRSRRRRRSSGDSDEASLAKLSSSDDDDSASPGNSNSWSRTGSIRRSWHGWSNQLMWSNCPTRIPTGEVDISITLPNFPGMTRLFYIAGLSELDPPGS